MGGTAGASGQGYDGHVSIRTPDQRLRVFVSSTLQELAEDRRAVREAIESLRLTPVMFEQGARPHPPRALYRAYLEQSDVFIGLYGERYGWVAPGEEMSGLEDEYRLSGDRPKLIYIRSPASNREPQLAKLIERIRRDDRASYRSFSDPDELRSLVADDLAVLLTERFSDTTPRAGASWSQTLPSLPRPPTRLIGRDEDVARVLDLLADHDTRLVTITGTGGIGKSRLALAVAERAKDRYADGVAYVELAAVTEPPLLLPTIGRALGLQEGTGASIGTQLGDVLAEARMLIVLDNMEQLADAGVVLSDLLAGADSLQFLVTSRRILDILGERLFALEPLAVPAADGAITCGFLFTRGRPSSALAPSTPGINRATMTWQPSPSSHDASTGCRWRSSWPLPRCACSRPAPSSSAWDTGPSSSCRPARATCHRASGPCAPP